MHSTNMVVSHTTPLIALSLIGRLNVLHLLYGVVYIPPAVHRDLLACDRARTRQLEVSLATWLKEMPLKNPDADWLVAELDVGEAEVLALAMEHKADLVIVDERLARRHARQLSLNVTGTLGVLLRAKERGLIARIGPLLDALVQRGIWLDKRLIAEALRLGNEG